MRRWAHVRRRVSGWAEYTSKLPVEAVSHGFGCVVKDSILTQWRYTVVISPLIPDVPIELLEFISKSLSMALET